MNSLMTDQDYLTGRSSLLSVGLLSLVNIVLTAVQADFTFVVSSYAVEYLSAMSIVVKMMFGNTAFGFGLLIASAMLLERSQQRLLGFIGRDLFERRDRHKTTTRSVRLE